MMKILVTGATGFVGASLVRTLIQNGETELYITARKSSDLWRIKEFTANFRKIYYCNLDNRNEVLQLMGDLRPDIIYHTAAYGGFPNQTEPERIIGSNLNATIHLLDAARLHGVKQFINTGSSSEYGIKHEPMRETDPCEPVNLYGITKLAATNYCTMVGKVYNYKVCTLRLFSPFGELEDSSRLYPSIINALKKNERPRLSRPDSVRDFIEINKVIDVFMRIIDIGYKPGDIINVGSGKQRTIAQFYNEIVQEMGKEIEPIWGEMPPRLNEPQHWEADINKLRLLMNASGGI
jgi:nucleoside-diphosphate-sugar epimerase